MIPGGGPGDADVDNGFPLWTEQRTDAAIAEWQTHCVSAPERCVILALSAGSMNAPSARKVCGRGVARASRTPQIYNCGTYACTLSRPPPRPKE